MRLLRGHFHRDRLRDHRLIGFVIVGLIDTENADTVREYLGELVGLIAAARRAREQNINAVARDDKSAYTDDIGVVSADSPLACRGRSGWKD